MTLKDKVAIVTGSGGGGTGRATAWRLAREALWSLSPTLTNPAGTKLCRGSNLREDAPHSVLPM